MWELEVLTAGAIPSQFSWLDRHYHSRWGRLLLILPELPGEPTARECATRWCSEGPSPAESSFSLGHGTGFGFSSPMPEYTWQASPRDPWTQDLVQLPHEGHGLAGNPKVMTVVCHSDTLSAGP